MKNGISNLIAGGILMILMACTAINAREVESNKTSKCSAPANESGVEEPKPVDFFLQMGTRFSPIKKSQLENYTDVQDFLGKEEMERNGEVETTSLILIKNEQLTDIRYDGKGRKLTKEQMDVLKMAPVDSDFCLRTFFQSDSEIAKSEGYNEFRPHFTVAPETQASYVFGFAAVCDYLEKTIESDLVGLSQDDLAPGRMHFIIDGNGHINHVEMAMSCGIEKIDEKLKRSLSTLPGQWFPAKNAEGEAISQKFTFSYGQIGC